MSQEDKTKQLEAVAGEIRELFRSRRQMYLSVVNPDENYTVIHPVWDGREDGRGVKRKAVWPALAEFAIRNNIEPRHWVDTLFSVSYLFEAAPEPNRLKDPRVLQALKTSKERLHDDLVHRAVSELEIVATRLFHAADTSALPEKVVQKTVLVHPELDASPVVRYVMARRLGLNELAVVFRVSAATQYSRDARGYDEALPRFKAFLQELAVTASKLAK